jgi:hypothetical protein
MSRDATVTSIAVPAAWESKEAFLKYIKKEDTKRRQICKYIQASAKCLLGGVASACIGKLAPMMCIDAGPSDASIIFIVCWFSDEHVNMRCENV